MAWLLKSSKLGAGIDHVLRQAVLQRWSGRRESCRCTGGAVLALFAHLHVWLGRHALRM